MTINALNSGAKCWLADFEDPSSPYWTNMINGQVNLYDAIRHDIDFSSEQGKVYRLEKPALAQMPTIIVRPRGLHLEESHILIDGQPLSGSLMDFGLYFFHNADKLVELGRGPYYVLPDRADVSMTQPMMRTYTDLHVHTCHKRGASAIGGMSAFIPDSSNPERTKEAMAKASPVLLEPLMKVEITIPEEYMGDVIGDINSRRGKMEGMEMRNGAQVINSYVPLSEMFGYATSLRSNTQGRGLYTMQFDHYEAVPASIAEKLTGTESK